WSPSSQPSSWRRPSWRRRPCGRRPPSWSRPSSPRSCGPRRGRRCGHGRWRPRRRRWPWPARAWCGCWPRPSSPPSWHCRAPARRRPWPSSRRRRPSSSPRRPWCWRSWRLQPPFPSPCPWPSRRRWWPCSLRPQPSWRPWWPSSPPWRGWWQRSSSPARPPAPPPVRRERRRCRSAIRGPGPRWSPGRRPRWKLRGSWRRPRSGSPSHHCHCSWGPPGARCAWASGQTRWIRAPCGQEGRGGRPEQRAPRPVTSELAVVAFLEGIEQVGGGVGLAVVFDLLVALDLHHRAVFQLEAVQGVLQVLLLHQHALEGGRVEAARGAPREALLVGVAVDVLELLVRVVRGHVGGLGDGAVHPLLGGGLHVHVLLGRDVVGGDEVVRQLRLRVVGERHRLGVDQLAVGQQLEAVDVHLLLGLLALADHVAAVVVRERGLDAVGGVVGQRQGDGAGR